MEPQLTDSATPAIPSVKLVTGLFFAALGILMTLDNFDLAGAYRILLYWPVVLLAIGVIKLLKGHDHLLAVVSLLAGAVLLAYNLDLIHISVFAFWPLALIAAGALIVLQALGIRQAPGAAAGDGDVWAILANRRIDVDSRNYRGGRVVAFLGGCELDLTAAATQDGPAVIQLLVMWGGVNIRVPAGWEVVVEAVPFMGGIEIKTTAATGANQLIVRGLTVMGGVNIKSIGGGTR